jgi:hypothetical protein
MSGVVEDLFADFGISRRYQDRLQLYYGITVYDLPFIAPWQLLAVGINGQAVKQIMWAVTNYDCKNLSLARRRAAAHIAAGDLSFMCSNPPRSDPLYLALGRAGIGPLSPEGLTRPRPQYVNIDSFARYKLGRDLDWRCKRHNHQAYGPPQEIEFYFWGEPGDEPCIDHGHIKYLLTQYHKLDSRPPPNR